MTDSENTEHISAFVLERFSARTLPLPELTKVARHLTQCPDCHAQFVATLGRQRQTVSVSFTLAPEFWLRHQHIAYDQLSNLANNKIAPGNRKLIDLHLKVCSPCEEDVRTFLAFRDQIAPELEVSYGPVLNETRREKFSWLSWWRGLAWKPLYAATVIIIGLAVVLSVIFLKRRADNFQAQRTQPSQNAEAGNKSPTPENRAVSGPSLPAAPNGSPVEEPNTNAAVVALNDRSGMVTVSKSGTVSGLDDVPPPTRELIAMILMSEAIKKPEVLRDLAGPDSKLRGAHGAQSFKLLAPGRAVILEEQPVFKWEQLPGAGSYRVHVTDFNGREVAKSDELPHNRLEWQPGLSFKRGEVYSWSVIAVVDGKEFVSPGPELPEMRFKILSTPNVQELNQVRRARSHLALGVLYTNFGLIPEAKKEFQRLLLLNPKSSLVRNLLRSMQ